MISYTCEVVIDLPIDEVVTKFNSTENLSKWQPTLLRTEPLSDRQGEVGSQMKLIYDDRGREMVMTETIDAIDLPDRFDTTYTAGGVVNRCRNRFEVVDDGRTRWVMESEFRFSGLMRILALFMRGAFPKETQKNLESFKAWVEST